jgi:hypothetical protein
MGFMRQDGDDIILEKPFSAFLFIAFSVGFGIFVFTLLLYGIIQLITSNGFSELAQTEEDGPVDDSNDDDDEFE